MIDHLVLATPDVAATATALRAAWGVALTPGGSHVGMGTRNELTGLGGHTYLEVVGPDEGQPVPAFPRPFGVDQLTAPALVAWCARQDRPLADVIARLRELGADPGEAGEMSRARPDGVVLRWRLTMPHLGPPHQGTLPFLIDWLDSPHPAAGLPHEATLETLRIRHPRPELVTSVLDALGRTSGDAAVVVEEGTPGLAAVVRTPNGHLTL